MMTNKEVNVSLNEALQGEEWLPVVGYEGLYEVSNLGRVKHLSNSATYKEKILKPQLQRDGYNRVTLSKKGQKKRVPIHRLVAIAFISNPLRKEQVNHMDADKLNNKLTNLEWTTRKENIAHAIALGLMKQNNKPVVATHIDTGEKHEFKSQSEASRQLGVNMNLIHNSLQGRSTNKSKWKFKRVS